MVWSVKPDMLGSFQGLTALLLEHTVIGAHCYSILHFPSFIGDLLYSVMFYMDMPSFQ